MASEPKKDLVTSDDAEVMRALQASLYPNVDISTVRLVLAYCRAQHLDPFSKPVHVVPMRQRVNGKWQSVDTIMPGINQYRVRADRTRQYVGCSDPEFGPSIERTFTGKTRQYTNESGEQVGGKQVSLTVTFPEWCRVIVERKIDNVVTKWPATERWLENYATTGSDSEVPNAMWTKRPFGQIAKCAEAQALRKAFPDQVSAEPSYEERGFGYDESTIVSTVEAGAAAVVDKEAAQPAATEAKATAEKSRSDELLARTRKGKPAEPAAAAIQPAQDTADASKAASSDTADAKTSQSAAQEVFGDQPEIDLPGDDWPEHIYAPEALAKMNLASLFTAAEAFGLPLEDEDTEEQLARAHMVAKLSECYQNKAKPALSMWVSDLISKFTECSTVEFEQLLIEGERIAVALATLGDTHTAVIMRGAAKNAKKRLGIVSKTTETKQQEAT